MRVTRIAIRDGKTDAYNQALLDEIYEAMRETVAIKDGDRFLAISEHSESEFGGRPPEDVLISMIETADDSWSFGNGETQFYKPPMAAP